MTELQFILIYLSFLFIYLFILLLRALLKTAVASWVPSLNIISIYNPLKFKQGLKAEIQ